MNFLNKNYNDKSCSDKNCGTWWQPGNLMRSFENWNDSCCGLEGGTGGSIKSMMSGHGLGEPLCRMWHDWADDMLVTEGDSWIKVSLAVPGVRMEDIVLSLRDNHLELQWKRSCASNINSEHVRWMGKTFSSCCKSVPIPDICDREAISADLENGVLHITMPKKRGIKDSSENSRSIKIKSTRN